MDLLFYVNLGICFCTFVHLLCLIYIYLFGFFRLEIYIYNHMKKNNLQDIAKMFAKETNIETPQCKLLCSRYI